MRVLELSGVSRDFAGVHAVADVTLRISPGAVLGLVGPNGSGKTTVVNLASGAVRPSSGRVVVDGRDLTGASSTRFADSGVIRTFQGLRLFEDLTVLDNVRVGAERLVRPTLVRALFRSPRFRRQDAESRERARSALAEVGMGSFAERAVGALSHGQRRRVELARAFAAQPSYLVLDEPGAGVDPEQLDGLAAIIGRHRSQGVGILVVEHDAGLVERLTDRVLGMVGGRIVAEGPFADVASHPALAAQLGTVE